jgi:riboflavin synthase
LDCGKLLMDDVDLGDSIAVNGVCLTVITFNAHSFEADVSNETLACTTLGNLAVGTPVNLEKALLPTTRLGGHLVSGHVDGVGEIVKLASDGRSLRFTLRVPQELMRYIAAKGSICVEGISLTVNRVEGQTFDLNLVPHTLEKTNLKDAGVGRSVNLEVDIIARYLERMLIGPENAGDSGVSRELLAESGFLRDK